MTSTRLLFVSLSIIASLCLMLWLITRSASRSAVDLMPSLEGERAISHLKDHSLYNSLHETINSLQYKIEREDQATVYEGTTYNAVNPRQGYRAVFTSDQLSLTSGNNEGKSWRMGLRLTGCGYGDRLMKITSGSMSVDGNRIEISKAAVSGLPSKVCEQSHPSTNNRLLTTDHRPLLTEWYTNRPEGLEQGFTLTSAPGERQEGERLRLRLEVEGDLKARLADEGQAVELIGAGSLRYDNLHVHDAEGRELKSWMKVESGQVWIEVEERDAVYPVTIDPTFSQAQKLTAPDGLPNDSFGESVAIEGDTVVVGTAGVGAYVFVRAGGVWSEQQKLTPSDGGSGDAFGGSVAISGDTVVIGAAGRDLAAGAAYVFVRAGGVWSEQQKLTASDRMIADLFGFTVVINGDTVIVGAPNDDAGAGSLQGSAYVYIRAGGVWSEYQKLTASDGGMSSQFGNSVAISGETIVVGAYNHGIGKGAVYVFVRAAGVWNEQQKLTASDGATSKNFGFSVAISNDTVVVGSAFDDVGTNTNQGSAYVFVRADGVWSEQQRLTASDGLAFDTFGKSVAIDGDTVVVGSEFDDVGTNMSQGSAYVFVRTDGVWSEQQRLILSDGLDHENFGHSVAMDGETIVFGVPDDRIAGSPPQGSAYIFGPNTPPAISTSSVTIQQGRTLTDANVASVSDNETSASALAVSIISGGTATGITLSNIANFGGAITADVAASCAATSGTVRLRVTDAGGLMSEADLQVNVTPNDPPVIACPMSMIVTTATPGSAMSVVTYPPPAAEDDCGLVSVVCNPPSGSSFPAGTTTITCTATDTSANTAQCSFTVTLFDVCIQDDSNSASVLLFVSSGPQAGEYRFCCGGAVKTGRGVVSRKGNVFTLTHNTADRRVQASVDAGTARGTAMIQSPPGSALCSITDRNIRDNSCLCGSS